MNARAVRGRIALAERGEVPLVHKASVAQDAGALALIIADGGQCTRFDQFCSPGRCVGREGGCSALGGFGWGRRMVLTSLYPLGADKYQGDGFARLDLAKPWEQIRIPVVLMLKEDAESLLALFEHATGKEEL